jgi:hypothetical protein
LAQFPPSAAQATSIFRNAILNDFQQETDITLDVELLEYRNSMKTLEVRFRWNRHSVGLKTGQVQVLSGVASFWLERESNYLIRQVAGAMPFGIGDPEVQNQARAGQVLDPLYLTPDGLPLPAQDPKAPPIKTLPLQLIASLANPVDLAAIDFETGRVRKVLSANPLTEAALPGEDLFAYVYSGKFIGKGPPVRLRAVNGAALSECGPKLFLLLRWKEVSSPPPVASQGDTSIGRIVGVRTGEGNYVLVDFPDRVQANYLLGGSTTIVNPVGQERCP